jgi:hypothetical protein
MANQAAAHTSAATMLAMGAALMSHPLNKVLLGLRFKWLPGLLQLLPDSPFLSRHLGNLDQS